MVGSLVFAYTRTGRYSKAEPLAQERLKYLLTNRVDGFVAVANFAELLQEWAWSERFEADKTKACERAREAERLLRDCLSSRPGTPPFSPFLKVVTEGLLGGALVAVNVLDPTLTDEARKARFTEAEKLLTQADKVFEASYNPFVIVDRGWLRDGRERLIRLYEAWDKTEKLAEWKQKLEAFDTAVATKRKAEQLAVGNAEVLQRISEARKTLGPTNPAPKEPTK